MFKPKTVDAAIAPLLRALTGLEGVAEALRESIALNKVEIRRLSTKNETDGVEVMRAEAIATKLREITGA